MSMAYVIGFGRKRQCPNLRCDHHICLETLKKTTENISHDSRVLGMNPTVNHSSTFFVGSRVVLKFSRMIRYYKQSSNLLHTVHTACQPTLQHNNSHNRTDKHMQ